jgi:hypothetical protein
MQIHIRRLEIQVAGSEQRPAAQAVAKTLERELERQAAANSNRPARKEERVRNETKRDS